MVHQPLKHPVRQTLEAYPVPRPDPALSCETTDTGRVRRALCCSLPAAFADTLQQKNVTTKTEFLKYNLMSCYLVTDRI